MATNIKIRMKPTDMWSVREKLALACSVLRSGDQNWMSVSRTIRPFSDPNRPADWFSQKNCAVQYSDLLEKVETPRRKRGEREATETPGDVIVRKLTVERIEELKRLVQEEADRYRELKKELQRVQSGECDSQIKEMWEKMMAEKQAAKEAAEKKLAEETEAREKVKAAMSRPKKIPTLKLKISEDENTMDSTLDSSCLNEDSNQSALSSVTTPLTSHAIGDANQSLSPSTSFDQSVIVDTSQQVVEGETVDITNMEVTNHVEVKQEETADWVSGRTQQTPSTEPAVDDQKEEVVVTTEVNTTPVKASTDASAVFSPKKAVAEKPSTRKSLTKKTGKPETPSSKTLTNVEVTSPSKRTMTTRTKEKKGVDVVEETKSTEPTSVEQHKTPDSAATSEDHPLKATIDEQETIASPGGSVAEHEPTSRRSLQKSQGGKTGSRLSRLRSRLDDSKEHELSNKPSETESEDEPLSTLRERKPDDSIPNSPASICQSDTEEERMHKTWKKSIMLVWRAAANHKFASIFLHPVTEDIAPGYRSVVLRPMDLNTIRKNIDSGVIRTTVEFQRDIMLMFTNALMYNSSDSDIFKMTKEMYSDVLSHIEQFVNTQLLAQTDQPKILRTLRRSEALSDKEEDQRKRRVSEPDTGGKGKKRKN